MKKSITVGGTLEDASERFIEAWSRAEHGGKSNRKIT